MKISLIRVPWDSGHYNKRMGSGPEHLVNKGLIEFLKKKSADVVSDVIMINDEFTLEAGSAKELNTLLAQKVEKAKKNGRLPIILSGNCNSSMGTCIGLANPDIGVFWFDAHADFNTPESTISGFFDGMGLSALTGNCWKNLAASIPGFIPVAENRAFLVGARDIDEEEQKLLETSSLNLISAGLIRNKKYLSMLTSSLNHGSEIYLHIDLDVFDPAELIANHYNVKNGLFLAEALDFIKHLKNKYKITAVAFTAYDPTYDPENKGFKIVTGILDEIIVHQE